MTLIGIKHLTSEDLPAAVELDRLCFGGLWTLDGYRRELESSNSDLLGLWIEGRGKKEEGRRKREEGRGNGEWGMGSGEEGKGEEERGKKEEGRGEEEEGISKAVLFSKHKEIFGRGSAPVPALNPNLTTGEKGATTGGLPLQEHKLIGIACLWAILGEGHITMLGIHPDYQGQSLGKTLLYGLLKLAHQRQLEWATLEVRASNLVAISLYQKFGFKEAGRRPGYYQQPEEDALILWRSGLQQPEFEQALTKWEQQIRDRQPNFLNKIQNQ